MLWFIAEAVGTHVRQGKDTPVPSHHTPPAARVSGQSNVAINIRVTRDHNVARFEQRLRRVARLTARSRRERFYWRCARAGFWLNKIDRINSVESGFF